MNRGIEGIPPSLVWKKVDGYEYSACLLNFYPKLPKCAETACDSGSCHVFNEQQLTWETGDGNENE